MTGVGWDVVGTWLLAPPWLFDAVVAWGRVADVVVVVVVGVDVGVVVV